jgi:hypothetical protein
VVVRGMGHHGMVMSPTVDIILMARDLSDVTDGIKASRQNQLSYLQVVAILITLVIPARQWSPGSATDVRAYMTHTGTHSPATTKASDLSPSAEYLSWDHKIVTMGTQIHRRVYMLLQ